MVAFSAAGLTACHRTKILCNFSTGIEKKKNQAVNNNVSQHWFLGLIGLMT